LYRVGPEGESEEEQMARRARKKRMKAEKRAQDGQEVTMEKESVKRDQDIEDTFIRT